MIQDTIGDLTYESEMRKLVNKAWEDEGFRARYSLRRFQPLGWEVTFLLDNKIKNLLIPLEIDYHTAGGKDRARAEIRRQLSTTLATQD
jgi:hypothetical protein